MRVMCRPQSPLAKRCPALKRLRYELAMAMMRAGATPIRAANRAGVSRRTAEYWRGTNGSNL